MLCPSIYSKIVWDSPIFWSSTNFGFGAIHKSLPQCYWTEKEQTKAKRSISRPFTKPLVYLLLSGRPEAIKTISNILSEKKENVFECFDFASVLRTKWGKSTKMKRKYELLTTHVFTKDKFRIFKNLYKSCLFSFGFFSHINMFYQSYFENLFFMKICDEELLKQWTTKHSILSERKIFFEWFDFASVLRMMWCKSTKIKLT